MRNPLLLFLLLISLFSCKEKEVALYNLRVEVTPVGSGTISPAAGQFEEGKQIQITAIAGPEYVFKEWQGGASGSNNPIMVTMTGDKQLVAVFEKRKYPLAVRVEGEGFVQEKVIESGRTTTDYPSGTVVELRAVASEGWLFGYWDSDTILTMNPRVVTVNSPQTVKATFIKDVPVRMEIGGLDQDLIVSHEYPITVKLVYKSGKELLIPADSFVVNYVAGDGIAIRNKMNFLAVKRGNLTVRVTSGNLSELVSIRVSEIDDVSQFDAFLKTPASGASVVIPVVVINFLPTMDGSKLDMSRAPDDYWILRHSTLAEAKQRIMGELRLTKFGIEEGTRFRQFTSHERISPYAGIEVVRYFDVYELELRHWTSTQKTIDYHSLFDKLGMEDLVNNHGVKEVWFTIFNKDAYPSVVNSPYNDPDTYYGMPESNMSSPLTGDISNSYRLPNDLPIYKNTYVVYGNSGHRGFDTNLHNRGHQIEAQLSYMERRTDQPAPNAELFYNKFVGLNPGMGNKPLHRAGMTHFPPNTSIDYDYDNSKFEESDIHTWQPYGGDFIMVNNSNWKNAVYPFDLKNTFYQNGVRVINDYTHDAHSKWLMYWWQAIPGEGNPISFDGRPLTNWWDVFYNWDEAIRTNRGLTQHSPNGRTVPNTQHASEVSQPDCKVYPRPR
ncbi:InlB B-repeat-containing protein [Salmonirosea aquatica]|uniref:Bacterial repeat domain-containing protein n=1 Tax=Salmonirosea aquatica TaxID=2654236 RepID=A0A7C9FQJ6_9BACT|nr:hypothetical protein [Cytophagaceae bacterium SJW1-29]